MSGCSCTHCSRAGFSCYSGQPSVARSSLRPQASSENPVTSAATAIPHWNTPSRSPVYRPNFPPPIDPPPWAAAGVRSPTLAPLIEPVFLDYPFSADTRERHEAK